MQSSTNPLRPSAGADRSDTIVSIPQSSLSAPINRQLTNITSDENDQPPAYENAIIEPASEPLENMQIEDQTPPPSYEEFTFSVIEKNLEDIFPFYQKTS